MKTLSLALLLTLLAVGCTSLAPGADKVVVTKDPAVVARCKVMGQISARPGQALVEEYYVHARNAALASSADTIFTTQTYPHISGVAYNCKGVDNRMPIPVQGFSSGLAPGASAIQLTRVEKDVDGCKAVGQVNGFGNGTLNSEALLRNNALVLGADKVFLLQEFAGMAYACPK